MEELAEFILHLFFVVVVTYHLSVFKYCKLLFRPSWKKMLKPWTG